MYVGVTVTVPVQVDGPAMVQANVASGSIVTVENVTAVDVPSTKPVASVATTCKVVYGPPKLVTKGFQFTVPSVAGLP